MTPASLALLALAFAQEADPASGTPFDRVIELEITEHDVPAIDGRGGTVVAEYEALFDGTLHVWTTSELDLFLRVDDADEAQPLASDDNSGGGTTPYVSLDVERGDWLVVLVAGDPGATGSLTLRLIATPDSAAGRLAENAAQAALRESGRLVSEGRRDEAREVLARALPRVMDTTGFDHPDLLRARANLGFAMHDLGDLTGMRALHESVLAGYERSLPVDHPELLHARLNLAVSMQSMGELAGARALYESVLAGYERSLPADHPDLLRAQMNLAASMQLMGDLAGAHALHKSVLAGYERSLPADDSGLLHARMNLASSMFVMGDLAGARAHYKSVVAARERSLPADHPDLLRARLNLASSMHAMGDLAGGRALHESVVEGYERSLPADHPDLLYARMNLANSMDDMGDLAGARALKESVVAARERSLPADHPDLLLARGNLANSMFAMGDLAGARALHESVLAARERSLPADHPDILASRLNLSVTMEEMGDLTGARALHESVLEDYESSLPADHPELLHARLTLAISMQSMGDLAGARELYESVLEGYERSLPADHPDSLRARSNLANAMDDMGDLAGAHALYESIFAARERSLPADHPDLLSAQGNLIRSMHDMGDMAGARALLPALLGGMRSRILSSVALAPRQARQTVASESHRHSEVLFLSESAGAELEGHAFELTETMRLVAAEAARSLVRFETDSELAPILEEASEVRRALNDLVAGGAGEVADAEEIASELTKLSLRRDQLERDASRLLAQRGVVTQPVEVGRLIDALGPGDVAVGYRRVAHWEVNESTGRLEYGADHLMAHVLDADGTLVRIDLGPASELEELAGAWRAALGAPIGRLHAFDAARAPSELGTPVSDASRGIATRMDGGESVAEAVEVNAGCMLRSRVLDSVLGKVKADVKRVIICADDLLFLLPLDALPFEPNGEGQVRVGDRFQIVSLVSFTRLLAPPVANDGEPSLLAMGGVDYDASGAVPDGRSAVSAPIQSDGISKDGDPAARSTTGAGFQKLVQAHHEAQGIATLFEDAFESAPVLLTQVKATKAALFESASGKRYLHLATHGWFAPESVRSTEDASPEDLGFAPMGIEGRVSGLAPMTLCGLALAGANRGRDSLGRVPGILTAEELSSLDLSGCELAVLSACETNVGIRRAGQGIQSLQSALYAAGARTSITSLWKVDDAATRRLMEVFYTNLWIEKMPKAEALWEAKRALRDEGHPPAHWAGWVLTGDPD